MAHLTRLLNIVLVIVFGKIELLGELNLSYNGPRKSILLLINKDFRHLKLFLVHAPNTTSVLWAPVRSLSVQLSGVMHPEEA